MSDERWTKILPHVLLRGREQLHGKALSEPFDGTWSFDEAKQFLTLTAGGKTVVVVVSHEVDWEASPRQETVVYAGTEKTLNATWWGKKVQ